MPAILSTAVSLPPATRYLTLSLVGLSVLYFFVHLSVNPRDLKGIFGATGDASLAFPWLVLVPGNVIWAPWTLWTAAFVETNFPEFLISILTLPLAARYLERVWGAQELVKFVLVTVVVSNVIAVGVNVLESVVLGDSALFMYGMSYHGLSALQVAFLVAFTQLIPEHQVQVFGGLFTMRVKSLPMLYVTFSNIVCVLGYQSPYILVQFGWLVSWFYLRFIKYNEGGDFRGDRSETFAFASWFPPFAQKYITIGTTHLFNLAVRFKVLQPWGADIESGVAGVGGGYTQVPGGQRAEAERRRQLALEALDRRMAAPSGPSTTSPAVPRASSPAANPASPTAARTAVVASVDGSATAPAAGGVDEKAQ